MLYYVKTDRLFRDLKVEIGGHSFFFDCTALQHKKSNEKRELLFTFDKVEKDGVIRLAASYSERGRITKTEEILKELKKAGAKVTEADLDRAMRIFGRQSEVDYFINKDAKSFLREQFDLWMYQYLFKDETVWNPIRLNQLQALKSIAFKLIDFIAQFEDELVRIWNKPKFVRGSHYVITLDRIAAQDGGLDVLAEFLKHKGMAAQMAEWQELGIVEKNFDAKDILEGKGKDRTLATAWRSLPLDTLHFGNALELRLLSLFDDLDNQLDGRLIKSENYQALNTLKEKFKGRVKCCYIDPPYNSDGAEMLYLNEYRNSSWLTLMENRVSYVEALLAKGDSALAIAIDDFEAPHLTRFLRERFSDFDVNPIVVNHHPQGTPKANLSRTHEYVILVTRKDSDFVRVPRPLDRPDERRLMRSGTGENNFRHGRPNSFYAFLVDENTCEIKGVEEPPSGEKYPLGKTKEGWLRLYPINSRGEERVWRKYYESGKKLVKKGEIFARQGRDGIALFERVSIERVRPVSNWTDSKYNAGPHGTDLIGKLFGSSEGFAYPKSLHAVADMVDAVVYDDDDALVLDFFAGSGTTGHAILSQNRDLGTARKYIMVEMAQHCESVILPRLKKVAFSDAWSNGKALNPNGVSHFLKYFALEQYEEAISRAAYADEEGDLFVNTKTNPYSQYVFFADLKMAEALELDYDKDEVNVHLDRKRQARHHGLLLPPGGPTWFGDGLWNRTSS